MMDMEIASQIVEELRRARSKHPKAFNSSHEGYAIILEELDELWEEIRVKTDERSYAKIRKEAIQIAAMCIRLIQDVCEPHMPK